MLVVSCVLCFARVVAAAAWVSFGGLCVPARGGRLSVSRAGCALPDNSHDCWVDACAVRRVTASRFISPRRL